eukprot:Awhi_evm1s1914
MFITLRKSFPLVFNSNRTFSSLFPTNKTCVLVTRFQSTTFVKAVHKTETADDVSFDVSIFPRINKWSSFKNLTAEGLPCLKSQKQFLSSDSGVSNFSITPIASDQSKICSRNIIVNELYRENTEQHSVFEFMKVSVSLKKSPSLSKRLSTKPSYKDHGGSVITHKLPMLPESGWKKSYSETTNIKNQSTNGGSYGGGKKGFKQLIKRYGWTAGITYTCLYLTTLSSIYLCVIYGVDVPSAIHYFFPAFEFELADAHSPDQEVEEKTSEFSLTNLLYTSGNFVIAYAATSLTGPFRMALTALVTPRVHKS